jgi:hypothetical protein
MGILEVQEAAKVINESVDKEAKVIFGMMRDEKLKKGQIRIIVIATGFPERQGDPSMPVGGFERSLFSMPQKEQAETRGSIYNEVLKRPAPAKEPETIEAVAPEPPPRRERPEPIVTAAPQKREEPVRPPQQPAAEEEDDAWGAIPSFLRRHKKQ